MDLTAHKTTYTISLTRKGHYQIEPESVLSKYDLALGQIHKPVTELLTTKQAENAGLNTRAKTNHKQRDKQMRNRNQRGEFSDVGIALVGLVAGFGMFTVVLLSGLAALMKAIAGVGC